MFTVAALLPVLSTGFALKFVDVGRLADVEFTFVETIGLFVVPWKRAAPPPEVLVSSFRLLKAYCGMPVLWLRVIVSVAPALVDFAYVVRLLDVEERFTTVEAELAEIPKEVTVESALITA